jgi:hypothetical protein
MFDNAIGTPSDHCAYIQSLSNERLDFLISIPPLGIDLLEHAAFCEECGQRIEHLIKSTCNELPPSGTQELDSWADDLVARAFPAKPQSSESDSSGGTTNYVNKSATVGGSRSVDTQRSLKLAASQNEQLPLVHDLHCFGSFVSGNGTFEIFKISLKDRARILLRGPVPNGATQVIFGVDVGKLSRTEEGYWEIAGITSIDISDFLRIQRDDSKDQPYVTFV